jgi:hypothetical protein
MIYKELTILELLFQHLIQGTEKDHEKVIMTADFRDDI